MAARYSARPREPLGKMTNELVSDRTVDRIYELTDRLEERLHDSAYLRERLTKAHYANQWPDLEGTVARVARRRRSSDIR